MGETNVSAEQRARKIKILIFDVDGVLTDGSIWFFPASAPMTETREIAAAMESRGGYAIASPTMIEAKAFHAHDGSGVSLARLGGIECAIITKRITEAVALRARDMRVRHVYQGQADKMDAVRQIMAEESVSLEEIAYLGDDVIDLPVMRACGLAMAVADARRQVREVARWVAPSCGGRGAARDAVEFLLEARGILGEVIESYLAERTSFAAGNEPSKGR